jgi:hypothetical protein
VEALDRRERERPLRSVVLPSNRIKAAVSAGLTAAAENLLAKALRAVGDGDMGRARRYVDRAVALGFDEHEEIGAAWGSASMLVYTLVTDAVEAAEPGDDGWLVAADQALDAGPGTVAALALRATLATLPDVYDLTRGQARRCRALAAGTDRDAWDGLSPAEPGVQAEVIYQVVRLAAAYAAAVSSPGLRN